MLRFTARETQTQLVIPLGIYGENNARQILFPIGLWQEAFGEGRVELLVQRSGDAQPYPVPLTMEGNAAVWTITKADVGVPGFGKARLNYYVGDTVVKSVAWMTRTDSDPMHIAGPVPEAPEQAWMERVLAAAGDVAEINQHPPVPGRDGFWLIWNPNTNKYDQTGIPLPEVLGSKDAVLYVPQALSDEQQGQARDNINAAPKRLIVQAHWGGIRDPETNELTEILVPSHTSDQVIQHLLSGGTAALQAVLDGHQMGIDAAYICNGSVAFPFVIDGQTVVLILSGDKFDIELVSAQGEPGPVGPEGPEGPAGADGYTPVKGVDYWTPEDRQSMVDDVLAALPAAEGVGF